MTTTVTGKRRARLNRAAFEIRPAVKADRPAIEAIAAQIWDGHDYLPRVFDDWLADPSGLFCVGVLEGQLAAVAKLSALGGDQWWMEGLRVDPAFRGMGIARIMQHYLVNYSRRYAPGTLRFSTASKNAAIVKIAGEMAFKEVASFSAYGATADQALVSERLVQLDVTDVDRVWVRLIGFPHFVAGQRTLEDSWRYLPLTPELLRERLVAGQVYGWRHGADPDRIVGLAILNEPRIAQADDEGEASEVRMVVGFADASPDEIGAMAMALRGLAACQAADRVSWKVLHDPALLARLRAAGYEERWEGMRVLLFARELALTDHAVVRTETDDIWPLAGGTIE